MKKDRSCVSLVSLAVDTFGFGSEQAFQDAGPRACSDEEAEASWLSGFQRQEWF